MILELALVGREYDDLIIDCEGVIVGETNKIIKQRSQKGGMFNVPKFDGMKYQYYPCGFKQAFIINNVGHSSRTSFTQTISDEDVDIKKISSHHWCHIMYIDDISENNLNRLNKCAGRLSIDFCKPHNRKTYLSLMSKCQLIFDSRERSNLWQGIKLNVPVILHDPDGCDCYYNGEIINTQINQQINQLRVNGAGDIFAAVFINQFYKFGLETAMSNSCEITKLKLLKLNKV